jgi:archaellum component FlaC
MKRKSQSNQKDLENAIGKFNASDRGIIRAIIDIAPSMKEIESVMKEINTIHEASIGNEYAKQLKMKYAKNIKEVNELVSKLSYDARMIFMGLTEAQSKEINEHYLRNA